MSSQEEAIISALSGPITAMGTLQLQAAVGVSDGELSDSLAHLAQEGLIFGTGGAWQLTPKGETVCS